VVFKERDLIYDNFDEWLNSSLCVWRNTIKLGNHVPIAAVYPELKDFFVDVLGVSTVTDVFMMKQLAAATSKPTKDIDEIKALMLSTSELLGADSQSAKYKTSTETLRKWSYLPCKLPSGNVFRSLKETFFIVDHEYYAEKFKGRLVLLDFTYEQLTSLHDLFRLLRLDDHYLARHVRRETSVETSTFDDILTQQFRQCAYAISW
jgi:hypothetical protein